MNKRKESNGRKIINILFLVFIFSVSFVLYPHKKSHAQQNVSFQDFLKEFSQNVTIKHPPIQPLKEYEKLGEEIVSAAPQVSLSKLPADPEKHYVKDEVVIKYKKGISNYTIANIEKSEQLEEIKKYKHLPKRGFRVYKIPAYKNVKEVVEKLKANPNIEDAHPNYKVYALYFPNDPYFNDTTLLYSNQTGWVQITYYLYGKYYRYYTYQPYLYYPLLMPSIPENYTGYTIITGAWEFQRGKGDIKIAVLDSGVYLTHEDLYGRLKRGFDYVNNDGIPDDDNGHGTHVAGIIASRTNNWRGVASMAPECRIIPIKVLDRTGAGTSTDVAEGIIGAVKDFNADILNLSLGTYYDALELREAVQEVLAEGAIIVAAAGNENTNLLNNPVYPACYPGVIAVGAIAGYDRDGDGSYEELTRADYSNYGYDSVADFGVDVFAPGGDYSPGYPIYSTFLYSPGQPTTYRYRPLVGTSMAAPHVSALCALLMANGIRSRWAITYVLQKTSWQLETLQFGTPDPTYGWGVIFPYYALQIKDFPNVYYQGCVIDDDNLNGTQGNGNGKLNAGELIDLYLILQNNGEKTLTNLRATLSTSDEQVTIYSGTETQYFGSVQVGDISTSYNATRIQIHSTITTGHEIRFVLNIYSDQWQGARTESFSLVVTTLGPLIYWAVNINDSGSIAPQNNGDGVPEVVVYQNSIVGEVIEITPVIRNLGGDTIYGVYGIVGTLPPDEYYSSGLFNTYLNVARWTYYPGPGEATYPDVFPFGDIPPYSIVTMQPGWITAPRFGIRSNTPDNTVVPMYLYLFDTAGNAWWETFTITIFWDYIDPVTQVNYQYPNYKQDGYTHTTTWATDHIDDSPELDPDNNGDGVINPGETFRLRVRVQNCTDVSPFGCTGRLSVRDDPYVSVIDPGPYSTRGGMAVNDVSTLPFGYEPYDPNEFFFDVTVSPDCPPDHVIYFDLYLYGWHTCTFTHKVYLNNATDLRAVYPNFNEWFYRDSHPYCIDDSANTKADEPRYRGNSDGIVNPGETVKFILSLFNHSINIGCENVYARITTTDPYVKIRKDTVFYPTLPPRSLIPGSPNRQTIELWTGISILTTFSYITTPIGIETTYIIVTVGAERYFEFEVSPDCPLETDADQYYRNRHHNIVFDLYITDGLGRSYTDSFVVVVADDSYAEFMNGTNGGNVSNPPEEIAPLVGYPPQQVYYPITLNGNIKTSPAVGDITGDEIDEIIVTSGVTTSRRGYVYVLDSAGRVLAGFPKEIEGYIAESSPALADLNGDGKLDAVIVASSWGTDTPGGKIYAWYADGTIVPGWENVFTDRYISTSPVVADINGDGVVEILIGSKSYGSNPSKIYGFNTSGQTLPGFPISTLLALDVINTLAIADIDNDGYNEIIAACSYSSLTAGLIYAWKYNGTNITLCSGFPINLPNRTYSAPAIADLDLDGNPEIVINCFDKTVRAYRYNGNPYFIVTTDQNLITSPAIGDLDRDGYPEIVISGSNGKVYAYRYDGSIQPGFPYIAPRPTAASYAVRFSEPSIADVDGDGQMEIVVVGNSFYETMYDYIYKYPNASGYGHHVDLHAIKSDGTEARGYPAPIVGNVYGAVAFGDVDGDQPIRGARNLNMIVGDMVGNLYVWDLPYAFDTARQQIEWNGFHGNMQRTGWYRPWKAVKYVTHQITFDDNNNGEANPGETIALKIVLRNYHPSITFNNVRATLALDSAFYSSYSYVSIYNETRTQSYPSLQPYKLATSIGDYIFYISPECPNNYRIPFRLSIEDTVKGMAWQDVFIIEIKTIMPGPIIKYVSHTIDDDSLGYSRGNSNYIVNPGETIELSVNLGNYSAYTAINVSANLSTGDPYVTIQQTNATYGVVIDGNRYFLPMTTEESNPRYVFSVDSTIPLDENGRHIITFDLNIQDAEGRIWTDSFTVVVEGLLAYLQHTIDDDTVPPSFGNNDQVVNPGEIIELGVIIRNLSSAPVNNVRGILSVLDTTYVTISQNSANFGNIPPLSNATSDPAFVFSVSLATPDLYNIPFMIDLYNDSGFISRHLFFVEVKALEAVLSYDTHIIDDDSLGESSGNGDGLVSPGEIIEMNVVVRNHTMFLIPNVQAILYTDDPNVVISRNTASYGDIPASSLATSTPPFVFRVLSTHPGGYITFRLELVDGYGSRYIISFQVLVITFRGAVWHTSPFIIDDNATNDRVTFQLITPVSDNVVDSVSGNNDGFMNPGERVELPWIIYNNTGTTLTYLGGRMHAVYAPGVTITDEFERYSSDTLGSVATPPGRATTMHDYNISDAGTQEEQNKTIILEWYLYDNSSSHYAKSRANWVDRRIITIASTGILGYYSHSIDDDNAGSSSGNNDGIVDPDETIELYVGIQNNAPQPATNVVTRLTVDPAAERYITIIDGYSDYGTIPAHSIKVSSDAFVFHVSPETFDNYRIPIKLIITYNLGTIENIITESNFWLYMGSLNYYEVESPRQYYSWRILDTLNTVTGGERGNSDGYANPGEQVGLTISLWNVHTTQGVYNVRAVLALNTAHPNYTPGYITLIDTVANFGMINPREAVRSDPDEFRFLVSPNVPDGYRIPFLLYIYDASGRVRINEFTIPVYLSYPPQVPGFPISTGGPIRSSPCLADLNKNGITDIIIGSGDGKVYAWEYDGTKPVLLPGWPVTCTLNVPVKSTPAVADVDLDGDLEVCVGSDDGKVYLWSSTGVLKPGWPQTTNGAGFSSPALADLDNDGDLEIIVGSEDKKVYVFHHEGNLLAGFPKVTQGTILASPAIADIDNNGYFEIIIGSGDGYLYVWDRFGNSLPAFPKQLGRRIDSSPVVGDVNGDGIMDIVVGCADGKVYAFDAFGNLLNGFPVNTGAEITGSPALGDFNNDGIPETIVIGSNDAYLYIINASTGAYITVYLYDAIASQPAIGDIDNDGLPEMVISGFDSLVGQGYLYAVEVDGSIVPGWQVPINGHWGAPINASSKIISSPAIGDVNSDGNVDITVGSDDGIVYCFNILAAYDPDKIEWQMFRADRFHSGLYKYAGLGPLGGTFIPTDGRSLTMTFGYPGEIHNLWFNAEPGHTYRIRITNNKNNVSPSVKLYAPDGSTLIASGEYYIEFKAEKAGIYYIKVENTLGGFGPNATYDISVLDLGPTAVEKIIWENYN